MSPKGLKLKKKKPNKPIKPFKPKKPAQPANGQKFLLGAQSHAELLIQPSPALEAKIYRIRRWGDPVMVALGFDVNQVGTTNFQAVGLYNKLTGFGAVSNFIRIDREDIDNLQKMQFAEERNGKQLTPKNKMDWLAAFRGKLYMYDHETDSWEGSERIRWGTVALGGNLVQVERFENIEAKLPGGALGVHKMARLVGFRKSDWARPLKELLAEGLVHRCYCAYKNNQFGDTPKGIVYSPFFSPRDRDFNGKKKIDALYIPAVYLEPKIE
ncbi:MAG: hypothetical protein MHPDNHAH_00709 [Anaerolineales bacterium]|nr:hypothetical protein [Anaerolineales bacterium]